MQRSPTITHLPQSPHFPETLARFGRTGAAIVAVSVLALAGALTWTAVDDGGQTTTTNREVTVGAVVGAVELQRQLDFSAVIDTAQAPAGAVANAVELERQLNPLSAINTDQVPAGAVANTVELQRQLDSVSAIGTNQVPAGAVANAVELQRQIGSVSTTGTSEAPAGAVANAMELQRQLDQQGAEVFDAGILDQNGGQPSELS